MKNNINCLIVGTGKIGRPIGLKLAKFGFEIIALDKNKDNLAALGKEIDENCNDPKYTLHVVDLTDRAATRNLIKNDLKPAYRSVFDVIVLACGEVKSDAEFAGDELPSTRLIKAKDAMVQTNYQTKKNFIDELNLRSLDCFPVIVVVGSFWSKLSDEELIGREMFGYGKSCKELMRLVRDIISQDNKGVLEEIAEDQKPENFADDVIQTILKKVAPELASEKVEEM